MDKDNIKEKIDMVSNLIHFDTMPDEYIKLLDDVKKDYQTLLNKNPVIFSIAKSLCTHKWYAADNEVVKDGGICIICGHIKAL